MDRRVKPGGDEEGESAMRSVGWVPSPTEGEERAAYPLMMRGSSIWWRGQIEFGF